MSHNECKDCEFEKCYNVCFKCGKQGINLFAPKGRVKKGDIVKHFKGKYYIVLGFSEHTENYSALVNYKALYDDYKEYSRPIELFLSKVDKEAYPDVEQEYRFEVVTDTNNAFKTLFDCFDTMSNDLEIIIKYMMKEVESND